MGSATHLSNKRWVMERWVFRKMGKVEKMGSKRWVLKSVKDGLDGRG